MDLKGVLVLLWLAGPSLHLQHAEVFLALYASGIAVSAAIAGLTWLEFIHFHLVPVVTVVGQYFFLLWIGGLR